MTYLQYLLIAAAIDLALLPVVGVLMGWDQAKGYVLVMTPLSLWTARLIVALRRGRITRRMPMLDGGSAMSGIFWRFRPEVYVREPGFDNFKGYVFKECCCLFLLWVMFLMVPIGRFLQATGI